MNGPLPAELKFRENTAYLYVNVTNMVRTTLDKQISRFFQGKITVFKD